MRHTSLLRPNDRPGRANTQVVAFNAYTHMRTNFVRCITVPAVVWEDQQYNNVRATASYNHTLCLCIEKKNNENAHNSSCYLAQ